jgi:hypothetical protein
MKANDGISIDWWIANKKPQNRWKIWKYNNTSTTSVIISQMHLQAILAKVHYSSKSDGAKDRAIQGKEKRGRMLSLLLYTFSLKKTSRMCTFNQNANKQKPWSSKCRNWNYIPSSSPLASGFAMFPVSLQKFSICPH